MQLDNFSAFADKLPEGMLLLTSQGEILSVNRVACRLLQRPADELVHQNLSLISSITQPELIERLKPCARSRTPVQLAVEEIEELPGIGGTCRPETTDQG